MTGRTQARETAASAAPYLLLGGFTAVAAGISAQGLTGFARDNMALRGSLAIPAVPRRQVQIRTLTRELAQLNFTTAEAAHAAIASLITTSLPAASAVGPEQDLASLRSDHHSTPADQSAAAGTGSTANSQFAQTSPPEPEIPDDTRDTAPMASHDEAAGQDTELIAAAARILHQARQHGQRTSQVTLGAELRSQGHRVANRRLCKLLAAAAELTAEDPATVGQPSASDAPARSALADHQVNGSHPDHTRQDHPGGQ